MCKANVPSEKDRCQYLEFEQPLGHESGKEGYCRCTNPVNPAIVPVHPDLALLADCTKENCNTLKCPGIIKGIFTG